MQLLLLLQLQESSDKNYIFIIKLDFILTLYYNANIKSSYYKYIIFGYNNMAKKGMIERELKRQNLAQKYSEKRKKILKEFSEAVSFEEKYSIHIKLQKLPRNSSQVRLRNRCWKTGKPRGFYRDFGLSRNMLREMGHQGLLPGLTKSSW